MSLRNSIRMPALVGIAVFLWLALPTVGSAQTFGIPFVSGGACAPCKQHCPPHYHVYIQQPPRLCWHHACPKPVCNPCELPRYGYFETCWSPFPYEMDYGHCVLPPPAAQVTLNPLVHPNMPLQPPQPSKTMPPARPSAFPGAGGIPPIIDQTIEFPAPRRNDGN